MGEPVSGHRGLRASWALLIFGVALSIAIGTLWGGRVAASQRNSFKAEAQGVSAVIGRSVQRDVDLADTVASMVKTMPGLTNAQFLQWYAALGAGHLPGNPAFGFAKRVLAAELPAFASLRAKDVGLDGKPIGTLQVFPPGNRSQYCLPTVGVWTIAGTGLPPGMDVCVLPMVNFAGIAASGVPSASTNVITPAQLTALNQLLGTPSPTIPAELHLFVFLAPVYRSATVPQSAEARDADLLGWVGGEFDAHALVTSAIKHTSGLRVSLSHVNVPGGTTLIAAAGPEKAAGFSHTESIDSGGRWILGVQGPAPGGGPSPLIQTVTVAIAGVLASLLVFLLIRVLASARARALVLVDEATLELRAAHSDRAQLLDRTVQAAEEERIRLAADLHDGPIQRLAALGFDVARCVQRLERSEAAAGLDLLGSVEADLTQEVAGLRRLMSELRPPILDERGLAAALHDYAASFSSRTGIRSDARVEIPNRMNPQAETVLYRVMQEAATNVAKHAHAENLWLTLRAAHGGAELLVTDDGIGFVIDEAGEQHLLQHGHFGLAGMRARLELVGGDLEVLSPTGGGTTLRAWLPQAVAWPDLGAGTAPDDPRLIVRPL